MGDSHLKSSPTEWVPAAAAGNQRAREGSIHIPYRTLIDMMMMLPCMAKRGLPQKIIPFLRDMNYWIASTIQTKYIQHVRLLPLLLLGDFLSKATTASDYNDYYRMEWTMSLVIRGVNASSPSLLLHVIIESKSPCY